MSIAIADTGIGIPKEALARLGRPFEQVESQLTKSHQGSGLGLAIAKSLTELHQGTIRIRSTTGRGTHRVAAPAEQPGLIAEGCSDGGGGVRRPATRLRHRRRAAG